MLCNRVSVRCGLNRSLTYRHGEERENVSQSGVPSRAGGRAIAARSRRCMRSRWARRRALKRRARERRDGRGGRPWSSVAAFERFANASRRSQRWSRAGNAGRRGERLHSSVNVEDAFCVITTRLAVIGAVRKSTPPSRPTPAPGRRTCDTSDMIDAFDTRRSRALERLYIALCRCAAI
ncbi:hypothetical protein EVAR_46714_1 [Eumeta japonica]|uniref:Uncharacterized protein n=1 Tax=Eumeta variegata TaxID=151549 RepID=A0A4C1X9Q9_EUMVA|nr:hypothetical protein EVAR_46714_1 [Eumeta japonica]